MAEVEAQDGVARLQAGQHHRRVGLRPAVRLHVGPRRAEQLLHPVDRQVLHLVHVLAAAVVALAGRPSAYLLVSTAAHGLHHLVAHVVLAGDQFQPFVWRHFSFR
jgi:hypothetical protein